MPKKTGLISLMVVCSLWNLPKTASAQALIPHTVQLDAAKLEQQGLSLAQEAASLGQFQQYELALPRARLASQLAPKSDKVWFLLGGLYLQTKDYNNAIASLKKSQSLNPKNADIQFALGSVHFQQQKYPEAAGFYQAGLKLKPNDGEGLFDLGNAYYMLGKPAEAIAQYNKAVAQGQKAWAVWPAVNNIALIKYEQGDADGALKHWRDAVALATTIKQPAAEPLMALAVALYVKGDQKQAFALGEQALRIDERYADLDFLKQNLWGTRLLADTKRFVELPRIQAALQQRGTRSGQPQ